MPIDSVDFQAACIKLLAHVTILPRRLLLETPGVRATVPLLRSVWGAALHQTDPAAYDAVFFRQQESSSGQRTVRPEHGMHAANRPQGYVFGQGAPAGQDLFVLDTAWIGRAIEFDAALTRAWTVAGRMGLGPRRRTFFVRGNLALRPDGNGAHGGEVAAWTMDQARWPLPGPPETTPCRLRFATPLRLLREEQGPDDRDATQSRRLIEQPTLSNLVAAALRRIEPFLPQPGRGELQQLRQSLLTLADQHRAGPWQGTQLASVTRWSSRQQSELEVRGVTGYLDLPEGPGPMWPLLSAARWLHLGKNTTHGLGRLQIEGPGGKGD